MLVISPLALFFSVGILAFLIISTLVVYLRPPAAIRTLPRSIDSPASVLAFVYGSEKLQAWAKQQDELGQLNRNSDSKWFKGKSGEKQQYKNVDGEVLVRMGYFTDSNGKERWGIELE